ncbi:hypothetical protein SCP_0301640 [Sparassis crispa]|uniref:Uncharacterized protein n=1 Tax=Sparassis crispa TaxID=139825 RepID=A0A401GE44_9APHY|nr:hypothetical protein SCP_0301640 [Sparassis crispa]GBE80449.1 hypothetical protein SCP_0301640 [Sparassis crispa]
MDPALRGDALRMQASSSSPSKSPALTTPPPTLAYCGTLQHRRQHQPATLVPPSTSAQQPHDGGTPPEARERAHFPHFIPH